MWHALNDIEKFIEALVATDIRLAEETRQRGGRCGGRLHCADYPRKGRGIPIQWEQQFSRRFSFCCAERECRKRRTPPSVRFLGRWVYVAVVVVACCGRWATAQQTDVPGRTAERWSSSLRRKLIDSVFWQSERARFMPPVDEAELPSSLLERFPGTLASRLHHSVRFLAPISTSSAGSLMDG